MWMCLKTVTAEMKASSRNYGCVLLCRFLFEQFSLSKISLRTKVKKNNVRKFSCASTWSQWPLLKTLKQYLMQEHRVHIESDVNYVNTIENEPCTGKNHCVKAEAIHGQQKLNEPVVGELVVDAGIDVVGETVDVITVIGDQNEMVILRSRTRFSKQRHSSS